MRDDAIDGVTHRQEEVLRHDKTLGPFVHFTPPDVPHDLSVRIFNMSATKTYIVRIYEVVELTQLPERKK